MESTGDAGVDGVPEKPPGMPQDAWYWHRLQTDLKDLNRQMNGGPVWFGFLAAVTGVLGLAGFTMGVVGFVARDWDVPSLLFGLFVLVLFGPLTLGIAWVARGRLRMKRSYEAYVEEHGNP